ncbi:MAG: outer membrane lipoprotein chaperone LolA [Gammaproteobacteria bacterium]|nr:outer membrane lipoprotein chaperone LolA [Gammaproteobacteria bacterium]
MRNRCFFLLLLIPSAQAEVSLQDRLAPIQSLQGEFAQQVLSEDGQELERSRGRFKLLQPGFFSWHIQSPDEQLLLATGNNLLHYDVELETATWRDIGETGGRGPLAIFSGDGDDLSLHYQIEQTGTDTYRLQPKGTDAGFTALSLTFSGNVPSRMTVQDQLRQTTVIEFSAVQLNPPLEAADFEFVPPAGVDLYYHER